MKRFPITPVLVALSLTLCPPAAAAQVAIEEAGTVRTGLLLRQLDHTTRVLMIGAHPDDEDTSLLSALARERGARVAYLALTRGEGGQNLIGTELGEGLGIVRTGELLAARQRDGAGQFFTRAFDFGYSKRAEEALEIWPGNELLADVVWVVRTFRPHAIVSVFTGTPADGHGQHQAAGIMARQAYAAAGDPTAYADQLTGGVAPWAPAALYQLAWRDPSDADFSVATGRFDPLLGRSPHQVAMESRSQHRSQDMGVAQPLGPAASRLRLVSGGGASGGLSGGSPGRVTEFLAGVDTSVRGLAAGLDGSVRARVEPELGAFSDAVAEARAALTPLEPGSALPALIRAITALDRAIAIAPAANGQLLQELRDRRAVAARTALSAAGITVDVRSSDDLVIPGQAFRVDIEVWNGGGQPVEAVSPSLRLPAGTLARKTEPPQPRRRFFGPPPPPPAENTEPWIETAVGATEAVAPGSLGRWSFEVRWAEAARPSEQYYLAAPRDGGLYQWPDDRALWAQPRNPEVLPAAVTLELNGIEMEISTAAEFRGVDRALGEFRQPLLVAPRLSVSADPATMVWPRARTEPRSVTVSVQSFDPEAVRGTLALEVPSGWTAEPESQAFDLNREGETATLGFRLFPNGVPAAGRLSVEAVATDEMGREYRDRVAVVDYDHIPRTLQFFPAATDLSVFDVEVASDLQVGYVMGSGDAGPEAIRELGVEPELLDADDLEAGDLSRFDVIMLGVRAYQTRPDLVRNNDRVLDFARGGGTLIVQYNQYEFPRGGFAPFAVDIRRPHDRVSVETAPVTVLDPDAPVLNAPNRIESRDFDGWVQERGLYFLSEWDPQLRPVFEMADPGEEPKRGSLLIAPLDRGIYVYTGLSFFRQLPAGVPGAYRLFANLLSLRAEPH